MTDSELMAKALLVAQKQIKESVYTDYYGSKVVAKTAKITGYGQQYFINQFLGDEDAEF